MLINAVKFNHTPDITVVNQKQFRAHYSLYENYVTQVNKITDELRTLAKQYEQDANSVNGLFRGLKRGETFALNGVILHELYFRNIGGKAKEAPADVAEALAKNFGSYEDWKADFVATGKASRGWAILIWEQRTNTLRNISLDTHDVGMTVLALPLLVLDVYEHAYFLQYEQQKNLYIEAFMKNIHWDIVAQRMKYWGV